MTRARPFARLRRLPREERGVTGVFNLFLTLACCMVGAIALDINHLFAARNQLQTSADLAAHAALYTRRYGLYENRGSGSHYYRMTEANAEAAAIAAVNLGMPDPYGTVVTPADILIGRLNLATGQVYVDPNEPDAAEAAVVFTHRTGTDPVGTFLFRIIGLKSMNVRAASVFALGPGECDREEGIFSMTGIRIRSGNTFYPGFCIGAPEFEVQNGNEFRPGVTTTIPTLADLDLSGADVDKHNPGLMDSLEFDRIDLSTTMNLIRNNNTSLATHWQQHAYAYSLLAPGAWTTNVGVSRDAVPLTRDLTHGDETVFTPATLDQNTIHHIRCTQTNESQRQIVLRGTNATSLFRNMVIVTNCMVKLDGAIHLQNVVLSSSFTSNANRDAINIPASNPGPTFGTNDDCDPTGGAAIITRGNFDSAAKPQFYGALVRVGGTADFQSGSTAHGVSLMAQQLVDTQSGHSMRPCGPAKGTDPRSVSFRMIR